jgi:hypothetical protein
LSNFKVNNMQVLRIRETLSIGQECVSPQNQPPQIGLIGVREGNIMFSKLKPKEEEGEGVVGGRPNGWGALKELPL